MIGNYALTTCILPKFACQSLGYRIPSRFELIYSVRHETKKRRKRKARPAVRVRVAGVQHNVFIDPMDLVFLTQLVAKDIDWKRTGIRCSRAIVSESSFQKIWGNTVPVPGREPNHWVTICTIAIVDVSTSLISNCRYQYLVCYLASIYGWKYTVRDDLFRNTDTPEVRFRKGNPLFSDAKSKKNSACGGPKIPKINQIYSYRYIKELEISYQPPGRVCRTHRAP